MGLAAVVSGWLRGLAGGGGFPFGERGPLEPRELRFTPAISGAWRGDLAGRERGSRKCWLCGRAIPAAAGGAVTHHQPLTGRAAGFS